eukprot:scaffold2934_cov146-Skeletonema_menzelii.AAC.2
MRVPELKILMKTRCGITVTTAPPAQNPPSGGGSGLGNPAGNAPPAQNPPSGGGSGSGNPIGNPPSQAVNDLTQALMNCNMSQATATQFIKMQGLQSMRCLKELSPDEMEDTISRHNKAMAGGNEACRIFSTIVIKKLSALVHSVRVFALTGVDLGIDDWTYATQIDRAMKELELYQRKEKNYTEAKPLKDTVKADALLGDEPQEVFAMILTNLGQRKSAHGCGATLAYALRDPSAAIIQSPSHAERLNQSLLKSGEAWNRDNAEIFDILEAWAQEEKALYDHIKPHKKNKDGRSAYLALKAIYLGKSSIDSALIKAQQTVSDGTDGTVYNGEVAGNQGLPWATYVGRLASAWDLIEQHSGDRHSQKSRVLRLIKGIKGDAAQQQIMIFACEHVKDDNILSTNYQEAATYLQTKIQAIYAPAIANRAKNQTVNETSTDNRTTGHGGGHSGGQGNQYGNRFGGRSRGGRGRYGGRGRGGGGGRGNGSGRSGWQATAGDPLYNGQTEHKEINGVDVSDVFVNFDHSVFHGPVRTYVHNRRNFLRNNGHGHNSNNRSNVKEIAMAVAEVISKRNAGGDNNPQDTKKSKGGEGNDYQKMFEKET